jgi:hypothetical protein
MLWKKYFNNAPLPITFYYTDKPVNAEAVKPGSVPRCIIGALLVARLGARKPLTLVTSVLGRSVFLVYLPFLLAHQRMPIGLFLLAGWARMTRQEARRQLAIQALLALVTGRIK